MTDILQCSLERADVQTAQRTIMSQAQRQRQFYNPDRAQSSNSTAGQYGSQAAANQAARILAPLQQEIASGNALRTQAAAMLRAQQQIPPNPNFPYPANPPAPIVNMSAANTRAQLWQPQAPAPVRQSASQPPRQLSPHEIAALTASAVTAYPYPPSGHSLSEHTPPGSVSTSSYGGHRVIWASSVPVGSFPAFGPQPNTVFGGTYPAAAWQLGEAFLSIKRQIIAPYGAGFPMFQGDTPGYWIRQNGDTWRQLSGVVTNQGAWRPLLPASTAPAMGAWIFTTNVNVPRYQQPSMGKAIVKYKSSWRSLKRNEPIPTAGAWIVHGGTWTRIMADGPGQGSWFLDQQQHVAEENNEAYRAMRDASISSQGVRGSHTVPASSGGNSTEPRNPPYASGLS